MAPFSDSCKRDNVTVTWFSCSIHKLIEVVFMKEVFSIKQVLVS